MTAAHPMRGALLVATGLLLFACLDATTKYLAATYEIPAIVAVRYLVNLLLMVNLLAPTHGAELIQIPNQRMPDWRSDRFPPIADIQLLDLSLTY